MNPIVTLTDEQLAELARPARPADRAGCQRAARVADGGRGRRLSPVHAAGLLEGVGRRPQERRSYTRWTRPSPRPATLKASIRLKRHSPILGADADVGFADYARECIATYRGRTRNGTPRDVTLADYRRALGLDADGAPTGKGAIAFFDNKRLGAIRPRDLSAYAASIERRGVAPRSSIGSSSASSRRPAFGLGRRAVSSAAT